jgi:hypothetical protein
MPKTEHIPIKINNTFGGVLSFMIKATNASLTFSVPPFKFTATT